VKESGKLSTFGAVMTHSRNDPCTVTTIRSGVDNISSSRAICTY